VIKPADRDRGEGVSVDVVDGDAVKSAFAQAHELSKSKQVIIERQASGVCHRLFIANGRLLYAVKRLPMSVKGDGRRTITQLVNDDVSVQKQKAPWSRSEIQPIDDRALAALASVGFSRESIPAEGIWAPLRRIESTADGGVDEDVTTIVHADNLSAAIAAARLFGLHIAGIDIISSDISTPWYENAAIINEVNFAPLLGGGEISKSHLPRFFAEIIDGDGKIPIEIFDAEDAALARQAEHRQKGTRCYFTTSTATIDFSGNPLVMPFNDIQQRVRALLCRPDADAVVICLPGLET
jgi:cyanophycin synthetase